MDSLALSDFVEDVHRIFRVAVGPERLRLELTEAASLPASAGAPRAPFSLTFRGPAQPLLPQGTYEFDHPRLGPLAIFIVPIGAESDGVLYQAIFA